MLSPGGQSRLVEAEKLAARAAPGAVGVSSQEAVSTAWVEAAVGYWHLHYAGMGGGIQQSLHSQTQSEREARHPIVSHTSLTCSLQASEGASDKFWSRILLMVMKQGSTTFHLGQGSKSWLRDSGSGQVQSMAHSPHGCPRAGSAQAVLEGRPAAPQ